MGGVGTKGIPEISWKGEVAMVAFVAAALYAVYNLVMLPNTWLDLMEELKRIDDDPAMLMFEAIDMDGDGYITRDDVRNFVRKKEFPGKLDADALFDGLDPLGSGRVSFEDFLTFMQAVQDAAESRPEILPGLPGQDIQLKPFNGVFSPQQTRPGMLPAWSIPPGPIGPGPSF